MPRDAIHFPDWQIVRKALEHAYSKLGLEMLQTSSGREYDATHWNIAGLVHEYLRDNQGKCWHCQTPLTFETVIRCLDCRASLCSPCAHEHFGPKHSSRAQVAHHD